ncbi:MAG: hypothetical protein ABSC19_09655 [Syntrophorhabdales bacterium]
MFNGNLMTGLTAFRDTFRIRLICRMCTPRPLRLNMACLFSSVIFEFHELRPAIFEGSEQGSPVVKHDAERATIGLAHDFFGPDDFGEFFLNAS